MLVSSNQVFLVRSSRSTGSVCSGPSVDCFLNSLTIFKRAVRQSRARIRVDMLAGDGFHGVGEQTVWCVGDPLVATPDPQD